MALLSTYVRNAMVPIQVERARLQPLSTSGEQSSKLSIDLTSYGLTINEAKIYVYLLGNGSASVRTISNALGLHRVDVYRKLHELENFGMLELHLDFPKTYTAAPPRNALFAVLRKQEERLEGLKLKSRGLISKLNEYRNLAEGFSKEAVVNLGSSYRLVAGRRRYYDEIKTMIRNAQSEVLRIVSAEGIIRTFSSGVYKEYARAKSRGISLKMISEINSQNRTYAKRLSGLVEVRHLDDVHLRFMVADRSISVLSARFDETSMSLDCVDDNYLVFNDPKIAQSYCFFFEHLWRAASKKRC